MSYVLCIMYDVLLSQLLISGGGVLAVWGADPLLVISTIGHSSAQTAHDIASAAAAYRSRG